MDPKNKIIVNTIILYAKIIINMIISLWTVPLVLRALGQNDYGLYNLVAGVVSMLAFLNASMTVVVQRYMSVTMGANDPQKLNDVYNAGVRIHLVLGFCVVALLELCSPFLFNGFLNIDAARVSAAIIVFHFMVVNIFFSIIAVPFDSALNAYENMLVFSVIAVAESVLKLLLAFYLFSVSMDRLIVYCVGLVTIAIIGVIIRVIYVNYAYKDIKVCIKYKVPKALYKEMLAYAGWNTCGSVAMIGKNQGMAIVLNLFKGTVINASYGIANQINGLLSSFTGSIQKAVSPQLMKKEGANQRESVIEMSFALVKVATIIFTIMAIPCVLEMNQILALWLHGNIPPFTMEFCQLIILMQLLFQMSSGVALAIDAVGKIKIYRIVLSVVLLLNIPLAYLLLKIGLAPYYVAASMIFVELMCLGVRLFFARKTASYPVVLYIKECFIPLIVTIILSLISGIAIIACIYPSVWRILLVVTITLLATLISSYYLVLSNKEKKIVISFIKRNNK